MEKYIRYVPIALFLAYIIKSLVISASLSDAGIVLCLSALTAYFDYRIQNKKLEKLSARLLVLEEKTAEDVEYLKNAVSSMKISSGLKTTFSQSR